MAQSRRGVDGCLWIFQATRVSLSSFWPPLGRPSAEHRSALAFDADLQRVAVGDTGHDDRPNPSQTAAYQQSN